MKVQCFLSKLRQEKRWKRKNIVNFQLRVRDYVKNNQKSNTKKKIKLRKTKKNWVFVGKVMLWPQVYQGSELSVLCFHLSSYSTSRIVENSGTFRICWSTSCEGLSVKVMIVQGLQEIVKEVHCASCVAISSHSDNTIRGSHPFEWNVGHLKVNKEVMCLIYTIGSCVHADIVHRYSIAGSHSAKNN